MAEHRLTRIHSIRERLGDTISLHKNELLALFSRYVNQGKGMLQPHQLSAEYEAVIPEAEREKLKDGVFEDVLRAAQEASHTSMGHPWAIRPWPGVWEYVRGNVNELAVEEMSVPEYLQFKEELVDGSPRSNFTLELDFEPFNAHVPRTSLSKSIGNGVQFLNRHLSSKLFRDKESTHCSTSSGHTTKRECGRTAGRSSQSNKYWRRIRQRFRCPQSSPSPPPSPSTPIHPSIPTCS